MKTAYRCVICLGSNLEGESHLSAARKILDNTFPCISWGQIIETPPEGTNNPSPYLNQAAVMKTDMSAEDLNSFFKEIEKKCGRTPDGKLRGIIPLDIDLLVYDTILLKPADMEKNYVRQALASIRES